MGNREHAGFWSRFFALLVDNILLSIIAWLLAAILGPLLGAGAQSNAAMVSFIASGLLLIVGIVLIFLQFFYFGWLWSANGQSFGMRVVNIQVLRRDGSKQGFIRAGLRGTVGYWISGLVFGLGFLWAAFDSRKEAWHDKLFDTNVFKA